MGIRHSPSSNRYGFAKRLHSFCALFALSCPPMGKEEWGGGICVEGGGDRKCEMMMMGDDDEMNNFLHSLHNCIWRA
jgi:hypothetical protein